MNNIKYILALLSAAAAFSSCSKQEALPEMPALSEAISVSVDLGEMQAPTKTTFQTENIVNAQGNFIQVNCYNSGTTTEYFTSTTMYDAGMWKFTANVNGIDYLDYKYYWPQDKTKLDFFAYYPANPTPAYIAIDNYVASSPRFHCANLPVTNKTQTDDIKEFVYAFETGKEQPSDAEHKHAPVGLTLHRPFTQIYVRLNNAIRSTLHSVTITNIKNNGSCVCSASAPLATWTPSGSVTDFVIDLTNTGDPGLSYPEEINNGGLIGGPFIVMPQALEGDVKLIVSYTATGNSNPTTVEATLGLAHSGTWDANSNDPQKNRDWKPGFTYIYDISLNGAANEAILSVGVNAWHVGGDSAIVVE